MKHLLDEINKLDSNRSHDILGSHKHRIDDVDGYRFFLWAPKAQSVSVVGDFNQWNPEAHHLELNEETGIWIVFVENAQAGDCYKYFIKGADGEYRYKADPYARAAELRPHDASILVDDEEFQWTDEEFWNNSEVDYSNVPINIYELHFGSWCRNDDGSFYNYRQIADELGDYILELGYTAVEIMPVMGHFDDVSHGYQITNFFAPTARYGNPEDLKYFVNHMHGLGIRVIFDWVASYFPKNDHGLKYFDGSLLYEIADSEFIQEGRSLAFNFKKEEIRSFLLSSAYYWISEYHADGIRVNDIDNMIYQNFSNNKVRNRFNNSQVNQYALDFIKELNSLIDNEFTGIVTIAEDDSNYKKITESLDNGGLGFDFKWDKTWATNTLEYFSTDYDNREDNYNKLNYPMMYNFQERHILALHHILVMPGRKSLISKMPGDYWRQFSSLRLMHLYTIAHPGAKLMFMGGEIAQFVEWDLSSSIQWFLLDYDMHNLFKNYMSTVNHFYKDNKELWEIDRSWDGFTWLITDDSKNSTYSWVRKDKDGNILVCSFNMSPDPKDGFKIPVPRRGAYQVVLNSDNSAWGGSDYDIFKDTRTTNLHPDNHIYGDALYGWEVDDYVNNESISNSNKSEIGDIVYSRDISFKSHKQSIKINLPPLAGIILKFIAKDPSEAPKDAWPDPEHPYPEGFNPFNKAADEGFVLD